MTANLPSRIVCLTEETTETLYLVCDGELHEIKSADILRPGPAALTDGLKRLHDIIAAWARR